MSHFLKGEKCVNTTSNTEHVGITLIFLMLSNCRMLYVTGSSSHFQRQYY